MGAKRSGTVGREQYALLRMTTAQQRMLHVIASEEEWERAYRWAVAWGLAIRVPPRCARTATCRCRAQAWPKRAGDSQPKD